MLDPATVYDLHGSPEPQTSPAEERLADHDGHVGDSWDEIFVCSGGKGEYQLDQLDIPNTETPSRACTHIGHISSMQNSLLDTLSHDKCRLRRGKRQYRLPVRRMLCRTTWKLYIPVPDRSAKSRRLRSKTDGSG
jgi:hypothetical protein